MEGGPPEADDPESFADLDGHCLDGICEDITKVSKEPRFLI